MKIKNKTGYRAERKRQIKNRQLIISGVFLSDVADTLKDLGVPATEEFIKACAVKVQLDAHAIAMQTLQELDYETALEEIELFRDSFNAHIIGQTVKSGMALGSGERLRRVPETIDTVTGPYHIEVDV